MWQVKLSRRALALRLGSGLVFTALSTTGVASLKTPSAETQSVAPLKTKQAGYVSAISDLQDRHWLAVVDMQGQLLQQVALPARAHQIAVHPGSPEVAIAARRPGSYLMIVDYQNGKRLHSLQPAAGHHFYGHAVYSADGHFLYTTENHIDSGEGRIFVRDTRNDYAIIAYFPSYGIGPHELKIHPDGQTLVVANGGIHTHPDKGRDKLNLSTMEPSLVYLSRHDGSLLEKHKLPAELHQLSIRHIDINQHGMVAIAMQYQGDPVDNVPLIAYHKRGKTIQTLMAPTAINPRLKNYCGSVCFNQSGSLFAVTAPRGNLITLWDASNGDFLTEFRCRDVCGISVSGEHGFLFSNGQGKLYYLDTDMTQLKMQDTGKSASFAWDNHLAKL